MNAQTVIQQKEFLGFHGNLKPAADKVAGIIKRLVGLDYEIISPTKKIEKEGQFSLHSLSYTPGKCGFVLRVYPYPVHENLPLLE